MWSELARSRSLLLSVSPIHDRDHREGTLQASYPFLGLKSLISERLVRPASRRATGLVGNSNQGALLKSKPFEGWYRGIGRLCHCRQDPQYGR